MKMCTKQLRKTAASLLIACIVFLSGTISFTQNIQNDFEQQGIWNLTQAISDSSLPLTLYSARLRIAGARDISYKNTGSRLIRGRVYITDYLEIVKGISRFHLGIYGYFLIHLISALFLWNLLDYIHVNFHFFVTNSTL